MANDIKLTLKNKNNGFGIIWNDILNCPTMTFKAKCIYGYIRAKPDNWKFSLAGIASQTVEGVDAISTGLKELVNHNLLEIIQHRTADGKFDYQEWILDFNPINTHFQPKRDFPVPENPKPGNPLQAIKIQEKKIKDRVSGIHNLPLTTSEEGMITQFKAKAEYLECCSKYPSLDDGITFDNLLNQIAEELISKKYKVITRKKFLNWLEAEVKWRARKATSANSKPTYQQSNPQTSTDTGQYREFKSNVICTEKDPTQYKTKAEWLNYVTEQRKLGIEVHSREIDMYTAQRNWSSNEGLENNHNNSQTLPKPPLETLSIVKNGYSNTSAESVMIEKTNLDEIGTEIYTEFEKNIPDAFLFK